MQAQGGLHVGHVHLEARGEQLPVQVSIRRVALPGVPADPLVPEHAGALGQLVVVSREQAPFDRGHVLDGIETEGRGLADRANLLAVVFRAHGVGRVLDDDQPVALGDGPDPIEVARLPGHVDGKNCFGSRRDSRFDLRSVDVERIRLDVDKNRHCALVDDHARGGGPRDGRGDDFIALTYVGGCQRKLERCGA